MPDKKKEESQQKEKEKKETLEEKSSQKKEIKIRSKKKSTQTETELEDKKAKLSSLLEKAKQLEKKLTKTEEIDLKKKVKPEEEKKHDTLVPIEDYLKSSIHLGTRVITPDMKQFVYKRRADGLAVFNTTLLDKKIRESADFFAKYSPQEVIAVCKREAGWKPMELFSKVTGIKAFTKKYPPGILTNPNLEIFREAELVVICDPWIDKNAFNDALKIKIPIFAICDTNNYTKDITQVLPGNNKSAKSLGMIFYLLAKLYIEKRKLKAEIPPISEWIENWETLTPPK